MISLIVIDLITVFALKHACFSLKVDVTRRFLEYIDIYACILVYMCMHIYILYILYIFICIKLSICIYVFICLHINIYVYMFIYLYINIYSAIPHLSWGLGSKNGRNKRIFAK